MKLLGEKEAAKCCRALIALLIWGDKGTGGTLVAKGSKDQGNKSDLYVGSCPERDAVDGRV